MRPKSICYIDIVESNAAPGYGVGERNWIVSARICAMQSLPPQGNELEIYQSKTMIYPRVGFLAYPAVIASGILHETL